MGKVEVGYMFVMVIMVLGELDWCYWWWIEKGEMEVWVYCDKGLVFSIGLGIGGGSGCIGVGGGIGVSIVGDCEEDKICVLFEGEKVMVMEISLC